MKTMDWNLKLVKKQLELLNTGVTTEQIQIDKETLSNILNNSTVPFENTFKLVEKLDFDKRILNEYKYFINNIIEFSNISVPNFNKCLSEISISTNELIGFVHDFFQQLDPYFKDIFNKIYKEKRNNLRLNNCRSYTLYISSLDYSYISSERNNTVVDFFNLIHEYTHSVVDTICYRRSYDNHYPFIELPSLFCELIAKDIIKYTYSGLDNEVDNYIGFLTKTVKNYSKDIISLNLFFEYFNDYDSNTEYLIKKFSGGNNKVSNNIFNNLVLEKLCYVIPFIYSIELYYLYNEDAEKAIDILKNIINMDRCDNYLIKTKKLGLIPNLNTTRFIGDIKRS